ncbi:MAG: hypothetical protein JXR56_07160 [Candidatus Cloacimonetes bacterium]|nr:hypothetical protein [Candidatus Cloacimonadota bacterium]
MNNSDEFLKSEVRRVTEERKTNGMLGLVGDLQAIIINTEEDRLFPAVQEFLDYTGFRISDAFEDENFKTVVLSQPVSASILIRSRKTGSNPFKRFNLNPKSSELPNTRLETFVFLTTDIDKYRKIQQMRDTQFMSNSITEMDNYKFIQTTPSELTGISVGVIEWTGEVKSFRTNNAVSIRCDLIKPERSYLEDIGFLDHTASRVKAVDRDAAIIEFMELTNYKFEFAIHVKSFNSITSVTRLSDGGFAMVFTSGIEPFKNLEESGPTEKFIYNYGTRTHHLAFITENIEETYRKLHEDGMEYLVELVGAPEQGLKQTFTVASPNTFLVNEYIHRYGNFKGFFTRENVTVLTAATDIQ